MTKCWRRSWRSEAFRCDGRTLVQLNGRLQDVLAEQHPRLVKGHECLASTAGQTGTPPMTAPRPELDPRTGLASNAASPDILLETAANGSLDRSRCMQQPMRTTTACASRLSPREHLMDGELLVQMDPRYCLGRH